MNEKIKFKIVNLKEIKLKLINFRPALPHKLIKFYINFFFKNFKKKSK
jgi:hypothetical protein